MEYKKIDFELLSSPWYAESQSQKSSSHFGVVLSSRRFEQIEFIDLPLCNYLFVNCIFNEVKFKDCYLGKAIFANCINLPNDIISAGITQRGYNYYGVFNRRNTLEIHAGCRRHYWEDAILHWGKSSNYLRASPESTRESRKKLLFIGTEAVKRGWLSNEIFTRSLLELR
jgi:hypothetical protein